MTSSHSVGLAERQAKKYGVGVGVGAQYGTAWPLLLGLPQYKKLVHYVKSYCSHALDAWGLPGSGRLV